MIKKIRHLVIRSNQDELYTTGIYTFLNPFSYLLLRKSKILLEFDAVYIDGLSLVKLLSFFNIRTSRKSFDMTSLAKLVFEDSIKKSNEVYFLGAKNHEMKKFIQVVRSSFPKLRVSGYRHGYFTSSNEKQEEISNIINKIKPDVVVVGMGTPLQEDFLIQLKAKGYKGVAYTCGGFIHQTSKGIKYYPDIINKLELRWLYRIFDEPKLFKRYFFIYPKAIFFILKDLLFSK